MLTHEILKQYVNYNPDTGNFTWLQNHRGGAKAGDIAGSVTKQGYIRIGIGHRTYMAHCLAWLYMTGFWPKEQIDHKDLIKHHNWWNNLREASAYQNRVNRGMLAHNTSGYKGVSWHKLARKWKAQCRVNGRPKYLGYFDDPELAANVYAVFARELHGKFYRHIDYEAKRG